MYYFYNPSQNRIEKRPVSAAFLTTYQKQLTAQGLGFGFLFFCTFVVAELEGRMLLILTFWKKTKEGKNWDHKAREAPNIFRKPDSLDFPSQQRLVVHKRGPLLKGL